MAQHNLLSLFCLTKLTLINTKFRPNTKLGRLCNANLTNMEPAHIKKKSISSLSSVNCQISSTGQHFPTSSVNEHEFLLYQQRRLTQCFTDSANFFLFYSIRLFLSVSFSICPILANLRLLFIRNYLHIHAKHCSTW